MSRKEFQNALRASLAWGTEGGLPEGQAYACLWHSGLRQNRIGHGVPSAGATEFDEPGVFMTFKETDKELTQNVASMGLDLPGPMCSQEACPWIMSVSHRSEVEESGRVRSGGALHPAGNAIDAIGAKRVVLDTIESLVLWIFQHQHSAGGTSPVCPWLKYKGVTAVITAETGEGKLTRQGIEEYVADCVILLDHRVEDQDSIRRLRVIKYRGNMHGTSEYPFLIGETGLSVLPLSSLKLDHKAPTQRVSTGVPRLDTMFGGKGYYRGTSILVSGGRERERAAWRRSLSRRPVSGANAHSTWLRNSRLTKWFATCVLSGDNLEPWEKPWSVALLRVAARLLRPGKASGHDSRPHRHPSESGGH